MVWELCCNKITREFYRVLSPSHTLSPQERRYSPGEREALACVWACEHWHVYLRGRPFDLRTDHSALVTLLSTEGAGHRPLRISCCSARLLCHNYTVEYRKGSDNVVTDALSRLPLQVETNQVAEDEFVCLLSPMLTMAELQAETESDSTIAKSWTSFCHLGLIKNLWKRS